MTGRMPKALPTRWMWAVVSEPDPEARGSYLDGQTAGAREVSVVIDRRARFLRIRHPELPRGEVVWPLHEVRAKENGTGRGLRLLRVAGNEIEPEQRGEARLDLVDPDFIAALRAACPDLGKTDLPRGMLRKVGLWAAGAAAALALMVFVIIPALAGSLAVLIPVEREVAYGKSIVRQIERVLTGSFDTKLTCTGAEGQAALDAMEARLTDATPTEYDLNIVVFDFDMVNAFAAPGGQIVLMRGLIEAAGSPDEVAAVLAHEIGHVEARDPTRGALRAAGTAGLFSLALGDFLGAGAIAVAADGVLNASYTRAAETEADLYARQMLAAAGVDATGMAEFFERLEAEHGHAELPELISSHPALADRAREARRATETQGPTTPVITKADWAALRGMCD